MWKVVAADDEGYIREALQKLINWGKMNCSLEKVVSDGQELLEEIWEEMAAAVQVVSPQRHDAVAHQKRQHNERGKPPDNKPCDLFFRCGQPERPVIDDWEPFLLD